MKETECPLKGPALAVRKHGNTQRALPITDALTSTVLDRCEPCAYETSSTVDGKFGVPVLGSGNEGRTFAPERVEVLLQFVVCPTQVLWC